jgi:hypothetical protein
VEPLLDKETRPSEDLQEGFTWGGVTVVNPFAAAVHPLLAMMLET